jgi:hypothetical protein
MIDDFSLNTEIVVLRPAMKSYFGGLCLKNILLLFREPGQ